MEVLLQLKKKEKLFLILFTLLYNNIIGKFIIAPAVTSVTVIV